jgi:hypothetical protein
MQRSKKIKKTISEEFSSIKEAADFWDTHDLTDFWEDTKEIKCDSRVPSVPRYIPLEKEIAEKIVKISRQQHISSETLVNLWIKERLLRC